MHVDIFGIWLHIQMCVRVFTLCFRYDILKLSEEFVLLHI